MKSTPQTTAVKKKVTSVANPVSTSPPLVVRTPFGQDFLENCAASLKKDIDASAAKRDELQSRRVEQCRQSREDGDNTSMRSILDLTSREIATNEYRILRDIVAQSKIQNGTYGVCPGCPLAVKPASCLCNGFISAETLMKGAHYDMCDACKLCKITPRKNGASPCLGNTLIYAPLK